MKILLLDKDGTLVTPKSGEKFVKAPWDQEGIKGAESFIQTKKEDGWTPFVVSNQGGIDAGHKSLEDCFQEMRFCMELLRVEEAFFCPDYEGNICWRCWGNCDESHRIKYSPESLDVQVLEIAGQFRKPGPGMLRLAIALHGADEALYIGDRPEDEGAAIAAGIPFQWAKEIHA